MKRILKRLSFVLSVVLLLGLIGAAFIGCGGDAMPDESNLLKLEAEKAVVEPAPGKTYVANANSRSDKVTSNGKYVSGINETNTTVTWLFTAESAGTTDLYFMVANATKSAAAFDAGEGKVFSVRINDADAAGPAVEAAGEFLDAWQPVKIADVALAAGINKVVLKITDQTGAVNIDYLGVDMKKAAVAEHTFRWKDTVVAATCEEGGSVTRKCSECGYEYLYSVQEALGHEWGEPFFDSAYTYIGENGESVQGAMVKECSRCGEKERVGTRPSGYFGEFKESESAYIGTVRTHKTAFEAEDANVALPSGYDGAAGVATHIASRPEASESQILANVSGADNYVKYEILSSEVTVADIVLVIANTRNDRTNMLAMDPMSDYVSMKLYNEEEGDFVDEVAHYNTGTPAKSNDPVDVGVVDGAQAANRAAGEDFDFSYTVFPGRTGTNYYEWRYILIRDVVMEQGLNTIVFRPAEGQKTIPNLDVLYFYTDADTLVPLAADDITGAELKSAYTSGTYTVKNQFTKAQDADEYTLLTGKEVSGELAVELTATGAANLSQAVQVTYQGRTVRLPQSLVAAGAGNYVLTVPGIRAEVGKSVAEIRYFDADPAVTVTGVSLYAATAAVPAHNAAVFGIGDQTWDAFLNGQLTPKLTYEAEEDAVLSEAAKKEVADRTAQADASGDKSVGNLNQNGNKIVWKFTPSAACEADIAIRLACSNYQSVAPAGNRSMIDLGKFIRLTVNGVAADLSGVDLILPEGETGYFLWRILVLEGLQLIAGENTVEITVIGGACPNLDVLYVYSGDNVTFTPAAV